MTLAGSPKVAFTSGAFAVPPDYFVVSHASLLGSRRAKVFAPKIEITDASLQVEAEQVLPQLPRWVPMVDRWQFQLLFRTSGFFIERAVAKWDPDIIHQHFATYGDGAVRASRQLGVPLVTTLHGHDAYRLKDPGSTRMARWYTESLRRIRDQSTQLLAVSQFFANEVRRLGWPAHKIAVHYQGTDTDFFRPDDAVYHSQDHELPIILAVGAIAAHKGAVQIAKASAELVSVHPHRLVFVGDGPQRPQIARIAATAPHIELTGSTDRTGVRDWMRRADLFVMNSQLSAQGRRESAGLVALEAQACGLPVAIGRSGGTPEMFDEGVSGFGFDEASETGLRAALIELLDMSHADRRGLGRAGREFVVSQRSLTSSLAQAEQIWASLL